MHTYSSFCFAFAFALLFFIMKTHTHIPTDRTFCRIHQRKRTNERTNEPTQKRAHIYTNTRTHAVQEYTIQSMTNNNNNRTSRMDDDDNATTNNRTYVIHPQIHRFSELSALFTAGKVEWRKKLKINFMKTYRCTVQPATLPLAR